MTRPGLPKLIATDLDGTLVRDDETVSAYTHEVMAQIRAAGIRIVGATGRGLRLMDMILRDIPSADFLVLGGGGQVAEVSDPSNPIMLRDERLPGQVLGDVLATIEAEVGPLSVLVEAGDYRDAPLLGDFDPTWRYPDRFQVSTRAQALAGPVIKGLARHPHHDADTLLLVARRLIPPRVASITQAGLGYIEICPPNVDKATGLAVIGTALGVAASDVLAFGDMPNDLPMLRWAEFGRVAVANAHPVIRAIADEITASNDDDGVAVYLDRLLRGV